MNIRSFTESASFPATTLTKSWAITGSFFARESGATESNNFVSESASETAYYPFTSSRFVNNSSNEYATYTLTLGRSFIGLTNFDEENETSFNAATLTKLTVSVKPDIHTVDSEGKPIVVQGPGYNTTTVTTDLFSVVRAHTYTVKEIDSFKPVSYPLEAYEAQLSFSTTTISVPSAKVVSADTYTFLRPTTGSTTTKYYLFTSGTDRTTGSSTYNGPSAVYKTVTRGKFDFLTYARTKWEVFDNSDDKSVFKVLAGEGGAPSYEKLQAGHIIREEGLSFKVGQIIFLSKYPESSPPVTLTSSWEGYLSTESFYDATEESWELFTATSEGLTDTTLATTTEIFGTNIDATLDTTTTYVETYEYYSYSTTQYAGYQIYDSWFKTSQVTVYQFTKTVNRVSIGTKPQISTYGQTITNYITTTSSTSWEQMYQGSTFTLGTGLELITSIVNSFVTATLIGQGAIVGSIYAATQSTSFTRLSTKVISIVTHFNPETAINNNGDLILNGNFVSSYFTFSGAGKYDFSAPIIAGATTENFLLEPVGPPGIGGVHRSGNKLELEDNCPHTFPAILLWQGVDPHSLVGDTIYAAAFASSFYEGGIPLISHNTPWEYESRTYNWVTADGEKGTLEVQWEVNSASTSSATFTIGVKGECNYTGGKQTSQAGGKYFSDRKATLVVNCPAVVSIQGGTKSFGIGTYEVTEPMCFDTVNFGSVISSGIAILGPTYLPYDYYITA